MRSLFSGVAGLRNHQTRMDVIGNNISNVNTIGFKASRVNFQDVLSQTVQGASSPQGSRGGTNPMQIGLGMSVASIDTVFTDGSFQPTGKQTDLSIKGQGFFILSDGANKVYTRAGNFDFDTKGNYLVPGTGYKVMGWMADGSGKIDTNADLTNIQIPVGAPMPAQATTKITYSHNLDAKVVAGTSVPTSTLVYDSLGTEYTANVNFFKGAANNTWLAGVSIPGITGLTNSLKEIKFDTNGQVISVTDATFTGNPKQVTLAGINLVDAVGSNCSFTRTVYDESLTKHDLTFTFTGNDGSGKFDYKIMEGNKLIATSGTTPISVTDGTTFNIPGVTVGGSTLSLDFTNPKIAGVTAAAAPTVSQNTATTPGTGLSPITFTPAGASQEVINLDFTKLTQFGQESTAQVVDKDGYTAGTLDFTTMSSSGVLVGNFTNGQHRDLAQVALANFNNPGGLNKIGDSLYTESNNSGVAQTGTAGSGGRGTFNPGTLEMSNVDLAQEFSNMIITQRGFQANSKIITVSDEMLQDLANLKR